MYLKSVSIENFRKFRNKDNVIEFIDANDYKKNSENGNINIAPITTLIIGKNNSGKTTVIEALNKLINDSTFKATDFNFTYLKELLELYKDEYLDNEDIKLPFLRFVITVGIDNNEEDFLTNIIPFMSLEDTYKSKVDIIVKWEVKDKALFIKDIKSFNKKNFKDQRFDRFLELINKTEFEMAYYNSNEEKRKNFALKKLMQLTSIKANNISNNSCLSEAFRKIIEYRYKEVVEDNIVDALDDEIIGINEKLTLNMTEHHTKSINDSLSKVVINEKCQILLKSDLDFSKLIKNVIKYEYVEGDNNIPEQQFGLGYTNLMMIIADIITYMEKYPETSFNSQVNLISIEEPETFMHPQMQEQFIKNINEMISSLLKEKNKHVNSQIIITTHSAHILNSKIHAGETFNNINYITSIKGCSKAICLNDDVIVPTKEVVKTDKSTEGVEEAEEEAAAEIAEDSRMQKLKFLRKHIKYKVPELFFADAIIFVEGITEYTVLQYYIDKNEKLNKYYISVILVDGAHAKVYENLINVLGVPTLIVTDIDIKREKWEKGEKEKQKKIKYLQMDSTKLGKRVTTNETLNHFYGTNIVSEIMESGFKEISNLIITYQKDPIKNYYATSFEEAFILTNSENAILQSVLSKVKPSIYNEIVSNGGVILNSFMLQRKLSSSKSDFANTLLYEILLCDDDTNNPKLPQYIEDGLKFLEKKLGGN
ncbi:ATP-dependent nuclease [Clostridium sp. ZS2-4]|uniref:ATP-dependent nuclease n=1 Tax=Clostridium sp. ZS2-4 TaxID=2987703 RepID=UPI00227A1303|nr:AAA family ATPase [Clostridium sp. ZS2-4]MCY6354399.1 AAA family ATPase [Clostridium sp. ZS2-4]